MSRTHALTRMVAAVLVLGAITQQVMGIRAGITGARISRASTTGPKGTGSILRTVRVGMHPSLIAVDERTGRAFVASVFIPLRGSPYTSVSVLDTKSGVVRRTVTLGGFADPVALTVDKQNNRVFIVNRGLLGKSPTGKGTVSVLDATSGRVVRTVAVGMSPIAIGVDEQARRAFVANDGTLSRDGFPTGKGTLSVLDTTSGTVLRTVAVGQGPQAVAVAARAGRVFVVNSYGDTITVLDARTGGVRRTIAMARGTFPIAVALDERSGHAFVANAVGTVSVLDVPTGASRRSVKVGRFIYLPPAVMVDGTTGRVFIANHNGGTVKVLDARSAAVLRTVAVGQGPIAIAVDERIGRTLVVNRGSLAGYQAVNGTVSILDAASGRMIATVPVGLAPESIGVDTRTGRAFIANTGADTVTVVDVSH